MIAFLRGQVVHLESHRCIVDVHDVGYEVHATNRDIGEWLKAGGPVEVHVSTQVREDAIALFGFSRPLDREAFERLLGVAGIGPKVALATLDALTVEELSAAVETTDLTALSRISGVGKKTAQRMALELKGKLPAAFEPPAGGAVYRVGGDSHTPDTLVLALERLGYNRTEIDRVSQLLPERGLTREDPVEERLRAALSILYGGQS